KRVGTDEMWDHAERVMATVLSQIEAQGHNHRIKTSINPGEGAFYGPKFEYVLRDAIGRDWQCGTTQVDFNLPERFGAFSIDADARRAGLRVEIDLRNEKINYKVREHSLAKIPALLVVGKKEAETHSVSVRRLGSDGQKVLPTDDAIAALVDEATPPDVKRTK